MGTTRSGLYLSTVGSGRSVSDYALVHSSEGGFVRTQVRVDGQVHIELRLESGGHGQKGIELLEKYNIEFYVDKVFLNGVRLGHVPGHKKKSKTLPLGQSWFPKAWSEKDIRRAGEHVAGLKTNRKVQDGKAIYGMYKGVKVGVIRTNGKIATVFPSFDQPTKIKQKRKGK